MRTAAPGTAGEDVPPSDPTTRDPRLEVSYGVRVAAWWSVCFLAVAAALYVLVRLLSTIGLVTITLSIAVMVTALLQPLVARLSRLGLPHALSAVLVFLVGVGGITALLWFVVTQVSAAGGDLQHQLHTATVSIREWLVSGPLRLSSTEVDRYTTDLGATLRQRREVLTSGLMQTASSALGVLSGAVLCLFATLFLMLDRGSIWGWFVRIFPPRTRSHAREAGSAAWRTLTRYMQSLVVLAVLNALAMVPVMMVAGLPLVVPLAVLLFLGSLVPLVGVLVAGAVMAMVALVSQGVGAAVAVTVALVLVIQLFGNLLNPLLLGKAVDIHPLAILVGVTGGTILAGAFGAFVAVSLLAVLNNGSHAIREHHRGGATPAGDVLPDDEGDLAAEGAA